MKTLIKIAAIAVITAFAVFSCAPEPNLTGVDWKKVNSEFDPGKNTGAEGFPLGDFRISPEEFKTGDGEANELTITFPQESDFLRAGKGKVEAGLKEFLSFHHFEKAEEPVIGKADTLGAALAYTFVRQNVNVITVKLTKKFVAGDSSVILKIDGTKYTYSGGVKLDLVGRGGGGQAGYDDVYVVFPVIITDPDPEDPEPGPSDFVEPGNRGWSFTLRAINPDPADIDEDGLLNDYPVAYLSLPDIDGDDEEVSDIYAAVADRLKAGLSIQKFEEGAWVDVGGATFTYDFEVYRNYVYVDTLTPEDIVPFRVVWKGAAPVTTADVYFGVNQFVKIIGDNTDPWRPAYYHTGTVYGPVTGMISDSRKFIDDFYISIYSKDFRDQNVVIDVLFNKGMGIGDGTAARWLKDYGNDKETFKDNFKIAYFRNANGTPGSPTYPTGTPTQNWWWAYASNLAYIPVKDFEMRIFNPNGAPDIGLNMVRITLDPAYKWVTGNRFFLISPEIGYTDNKTAYGNSNNFAYDFFELYPINTANTLTQSDFLQYAPPIPLTAGEWAEGNIPVINRDVWYSFPVTDGETYYIWVNDRKDGRLPADKTGDVVIAAQYRGLGNDAWIPGIGNSNTLTDANWATPASFTAARTDVVNVRVRLYNRADVSVGTYGIAYNTDDTRPGGDEYGWTVPTATPLTEDIWADGNIATPGGEQWFTFTASATSHYIHTTTGTMGGYYAEVYNNTGTRQGARATMTNSATQWTALASGDTYFIRVFAQTGTAKGTFRIAFTQTNTTPAVTVPTTNVTELTLGRWADGSITATNPEQWYKFTATATTQYIHASFGSLTQISATLYTDEGTAVGIAANLTAIASMNRTVTEGDTYYIRVRPSASPTVPGTYKIMFNERNSVAVTVPANVTTLTPDVWANGNLTMAVREQWYKFTATTAETLGQYIHTDFGTLTALKMRLYDNDGYPLGSETTLSGSTTKEQRTLELDATYFIKVTPNVNDIGGTYKIKFNTSFFAVWPPENPIRLTENEWANGNIAKPGGDQWFVFDATAIGQYIHASLETGKLDYILVQVYDSDRLLVGEADLYSYLFWGAFLIENLYTKLTVTAGETYYIRVSPNLNESASLTGPYKITFSKLSLPPGTVFPPDNPVALVEDTWGSGNITTAGGDQWFSFTANAKIHPIEFDTSYGSVRDVFVEVFEESGNMVGTPVNFWGSTTIKNWRLSAGGKYYIRVYGYDPDDTGNFRIRFCSFPPPDIDPSTISATGLTANVWRFDPITDPSPGEWYSFEATGGTTYYVFWEDADTGYDWFDIEVAAYDSDGYLIFEEDGGIDWECYTSFEAESTGTIYIKVYPGDWNYEDDGYFGIAYSTSSTRPSTKASRTVPVPHDKIKKRSSTR
jgi:hypothetical protein